MKLFHLLSVSVLCVGALASCTNDETPALVELGDTAIETKVVKLSDDYCTESFLVKFNKVPDAKMLEEAMIPGVKSIENLFKLTPGNEELEAQFGLDRWYQLNLEEGASVEAAVSKMSTLGAVSTVEYNSIASQASDKKIYAVSSNTKGTSDGFNDPYLSKQWHYKNEGAKNISPSAYAGADVNVTDVWKQLTCGDPDIIVAVVDEGVCYSHPDLAANMWTNSKEIPGNGIDDDGNGYIDDVYGYNFVFNTDISWNNEGDTGHGTHCAGTIAAVNNNGIGVSGIAGGSGQNDGCRIMGCQVFSGEFGGKTSVISNAIKYAADNGASIISCSFGYSVSFASDDNYVRRQGSAEIDAIHYFEAHKGNNPVLTDGNIAIFSAGNENHDYAHYPGAFYDIISVSAFGPDFLPTYYTNYGPGCNIAAPGGEAYHVSSGWGSMILSTTPSNIAQLFENGVGEKIGNEYGYMQGTSMACPHVSGVVALALSYAKKQGKKFTVSEFKNLILSSVQDIDKRIASVTEKTYAYYQSPLKMGPYYHNVGTGAIDAWSLMMHIDGINSTVVKTGESQWIDLSDYFGTASISLTYLSVEVPQATVDALGLEKLSPTPTSGTNGTPIVDAGSYAYEQFGRLFIKPTKMGSGKIIVKAVGGGDHLGGGSNPPGGMELSQEVSVIARGVASDNGGWL